MSIRKNPSWWLLTTFQSSDGTPLYWEFLNPPVRRHPVRASGLSHFQLRCYMVPFQVCIRRHAFYSRNSCLIAGSPLKVPFFVGQCMRKHTPRPHAYRDNMLRRIASDVDFNQSFKTRGLWLYAGIPRIMLCRIVLINHFLRKKVWEIAGFEPSTLSMGIEFQWDMML